MNREWKDLKNKDQVKMDYDYKYSAYFITFKFKCIKCIFQLKSLPK